MSEETKQKDILKENIDLYTKVMCKLVGSIRPVGSSETDSDRIENLKVLCGVVDNLVFIIDKMAYDNKDAYEASIKRAVEYAQNFLTNTLGIKP